MFEGAKHSCDEASFRADVAAILASLDSFDTFKASTVARATSELAALVVRVADVPHLESGRRLVDIEYLGFKVSCPVTTAEAEVEMRMWSLFKKHALRYSDSEFPKLPWEKLLLDQECSVKPDEKLPEWVASEVKGMLAGRSLAQSLLSKDDGAWSEWRRTMLQQEAEFMRIDRSMRLELSFCDSELSRALTSAAYVHMQRCMPSAEVWRPLDQSLELLQELQGGPLLKAAGGASAGGLGAMVEVLRNLQRGVGPNSKHTEHDATWGAFLASTAFFVRVEPNEVGQDVPPKAKWGQEAILLLLESFERRYSEDAQSVGLADVDKIAPYQYVLSEANAARVGGLTSKVLSNLGRPSDGCQGQAFAAGQRQQQCWPICGGRERLARVFLGGQPRAEA
jgi:hypothetical protein